MTLLATGIEQARSVLRQQRREQQFANFCDAAQVEFERSLSLARGSGGNYDDLVASGVALRAALVAGDANDCQSLCVRLAALAARLAIEGDAEFPASVPTPAAVPLLERI